MTYWDWINERDHPYRGYRLAFIIHWLGRGHVYDKIPDPPPETFQEYEIHEMEELL